jgi:hypothetical protein
MTPARARTLETAETTEGATTDILGKAEIGTSYSQGRKIKEYLQQKKANKISSSF